MSAIQANWCRCGEKPRFVGDCCPLHQQHVPGLRDLWLTFGKPIPKETP